MRAMSLLLLAMFACATAVAAQEYAAAGMVVSVNVQEKTFTASIDAIPGYMRAMTMPFRVRREADLEGLAPGVAVEFALDARAPEYAERIRVVQYQNVEQDPFAASRLALLTALVSGGASDAAVAVGEPVPDFQLIDQRGRPVALADLRGKVVAVNFVYTGCVLPNYCLRLVNTFGVLQKRFGPRLGKDLVLLTITFDPAHDTPEVLASYAAQWKADPAAWHFLTGPEDTIRRVCALFGVHAFADEGLMSHSLHTALIDRDGRLAANIEGNEFTADQLADLTAGVLE